MEELIIHVEKPKNFKILVEEEKGYRYIKAYKCRKNCTTCPLYSIGDLLVRNCEKCSMLNEKDMVVSLKIDSHLSEEVVFS